MDGFHINKKFYCKEAGILEVGQDVANSFFFDIGIQWGGLHEKDKRSCRYVMNNIHKLPWGVPRGTKAFPLAALDVIVSDFYYRVKINEQSTIAYKGGRIENDLLRKTGIPSVNLESFGCPKAEHLFDDLVWLETCGNHTEPNAYQHCAKVEVEAFGH